MKQLIEDLISAMEYHVEQTRPVHMTTVAIQAAKDALKAMPAAPVGLGAKWIAAHGFDKHGVAKWIESETGAPAALVQKPVAQVVQVFDDVKAIGWLNSDGHPAFMELPPVGTKFYTSPPAPQPVPVKCWCHKCNEHNTINGLPFSMAQMILCPECGNKRCPKASDHQLDCTGSNEEGQHGSVYTAPQPVPVTRSEK